MAGYRLSGVRLLAVASLGVALGAPLPAHAQNFFDFLFNGGKAQRQQPQEQPQSQPSLFDPFGLNQQTPARPAAASSGGSSAFCVRTCDGRYFPLQTRGVPPTQMCQAFCPATATKVFFGSAIDYATTSTGERYADSPNAFAFRKALKPDCTCNGRDPLGLATINLQLDNSLRAGDVVATANGLYAYSGIRVGANQTPEYTPISSFPGLTSDIRAKLGEMRVAPNGGDLAEEGAIEIAPATPPAPATSPSRAAKRASIN